MAIPGPKPISRTRSVEPNVQQRERPADPLHVRRRADHDPADEIAQKARGLAKLRAEEPLQTSREDATALVAIWLAAQPGICQSRFECLWMRIGFDSHVDESPQPCGRSSST